MVKFCFSGDCFFIFIQDNLFFLSNTNQVPLSNIKGTGPDGRILKADIEDYLGIFF